MANFKTNVNKGRRKAMRWLTKGIGKTHTPAPHQPIKIERVFISRPNHRLGNLLLITPLIQEVVKTFPQCKIDLLVQGTVSREIFKNYQNIDRIIIQPKKPFKHLGDYIWSWIRILNNGKYDLSINAVPGSSSGRLTVSFSRAKHKIFGDTDSEVKHDHADYQHIAKESIYAFRSFFHQTSLNENSIDFPKLSLNLSFKEIQSGKDKLSSLVDLQNKTIALFTFATGDKRLSKGWWQDFYSQLHKGYPNFNLIEILPVENISAFDFKIPSFYSKDIREIASVLANTTLFIGADSGMMHLASASGVPTLGLFCVTKTEIYQPYGGLNRAVLVEKDCGTTLDATQEIIRLLTKV